MTTAQIRRKAIQAINKRGILLLYPVNNRKAPASIWSELFPRSKMVWDWNEDSDNRVAELWYLKDYLSKSKEVVYVKWFQGRATFFARDTFVDLMAALRAHEWAEGEHLSPESRNILELLQSDSPLSTKQLKAAADLEGRLLEPTYNRALKPLWQHGLLVGFGEFEDSSFPSLGVGATQTLFEDLWAEAGTRDPVLALAALRERLGDDSPFMKFAQKLTVPSH